MLEVLDLIKNNAKNFELDIEIFNTNIFKEVDQEKNPCYLCARKKEVIYIVKLWN